LLSEGGERGNHHWVPFLGRGLPASGGRPIFTELDGNKLLGISVGRSPPSFMGVTLQLFTPTQVFLPKFILILLNRFLYEGEVLIEDHGNDIDRLAV